MTRTEVIAELDAELKRLVAARDYLKVALADSRKNLMSKVEKRLPAVLAAAAAMPKPVARKASRKAAPVAAPEVVEVVAATPAPEKVEPQVKRVPPRRRMERRLQADKASKGSAALSGMVPAGPVAVSATEARRIHERAQERPQPQPMPMTELRPEIPSERSLGSLIQAFERRAGMAGLEIP